MQIDVAMTATRRPEIVDRTLKSFNDNMFNINGYRRHRNPHSFRLVINVDPIGLDIKSEEVVDVARQYFDDIIFNFPEKPDFNTAFRYVLSKADAPLVFHLQDDWEACYPIDLNRMIEILCEDPKLALLRLSMFPSETDCVNNWGVCEFSWNGKYFACPPNERRRLGFCGHPSLIKKAFLKRTIPLMDKRHNPENQFHSFFRVVGQVEQWDYGVFISPNSEPNIKDIGREWMIQNKWKKNSDKSHTVWRPSNQTSSPEVTRLSLPSTPSIRRRPHMNGLERLIHGQI